MMKLPSIRYPFSIQQKVSWSDMDSFGHVNHTIYVRYFENARTEFFSKHNVMPDSNMTEGPVITDLHFAYRGQVRFPADLQITLGVHSIASRTFAMCCTIWQEDILVAGGHASFMWIQFENGRPMRLPDALTELLGSIHSDDIMVDK